MSTENLPSFMKVQPRPEPEPRPAAFDLSLGQPENFPVDALTPVLKEVAENLAAVHQIPVCLPAMSALAILSGAVGKAFACRGGYRDKLTRLNLYVVPVVERGLGKGLTGETLMAPLAAASDQLAKDNAVANAPKKQEAAELRKAIKTKGQRDRLGPDEVGKKELRIAELEEEISKTPTLWIQDATSEAMTRVLSQNGETLLCFSSEGGSVIDVALGKYTEGADFNLLLSAYSGDRVQQHRIGRKEVALREPALSLLLMIQSGVLRKILHSEEAFARGLTARMLIFDSGAVRHHDRGGTASFTLQERWDELVNGLVRSRQCGPQEIPASAEARQVFTDLHNEAIDLEQMHFPDFAGEASRWRENAIKIASLLALSEGRLEVCAQDAKSGAKIVRWCGYNYFKLLCAGRRNRLESEIASLEELLGPAGLIGRPLSKLDDHGFDRARLDKILAASGDTFERYKFSEHIDGKPRSGRPAEMIRIVKPTSKRRSAA